MLQQLIEYEWCEKKDDDGDDDDDGGGGDDDDYSSNLFQCRFPYWRHKSEFLWKFKCYLFDAHSNLNRNL